IAALESGQVDRLPSRVFVLNYIKAYAGVIGITPDEAILRFEEVDRTEKNTPPPAALERERRRAALIRLVVILLVMAAGGYALLVLAGKVAAPVSLPIPK